MDDGALVVGLLRYGFLPDNAPSVEALEGAVLAFLLHGKVSVPKYWSRARRALAAKQLLCRREDIEVGAIDGLFGPQTEHAFAVYAQRRGGPDPALPQRDADRQVARPLGGPWPREADVPAFFGWMGDHQVLLELPFPMRLAWDHGKLIRRFSIHRLVHDSAARCFERVASHYNAAKRRDTGIDQFGGCLNVRRMRGGTRWSMHSWGIAIDFDPTRNPLRANLGTARLAQPDCVRFWEIWEEEGWVSLGRTRDFDWMHVQAAV